MTDNAAGSSQTLSSREGPASNASTEQALDIVEQYRRGTITKAAALLAIQRDLTPILARWERTLDEILPTYVSMLDEIDQTKRDAGSRGEPRQSSASTPARESDRGQD